METWKPSVEGIQLLALLAAEANKIEEEVKSANIGAIRKNILVQFEKRGIPLLPGVVGVVQKSRGEE